MADHYAYQILTPPRRTRCWRPKVTLYRILAIASIFAFGISHAVYTERGYVILPAYLDWVSGVIVVQALYLGSIYEVERPESLPVLFQKDYAAPIFKLLESWHVHMPEWETDERGDDFLFMHNQMPITPYRLSFSAVVLIAGITKVILSLQGRGKAANVLDWSIGVIVTILLYCLGWYEHNSTELWSDFFVDDCRPILLQIARCGPIVLCIVALYPTGKWTVLWSHAVVPIWTEDLAKAGIGSRIGSSLGWFVGSMAAVALANLGILVYAITTYWTIVQARRSKFLKSIYHFISGFLTRRIAIHPSALNTCITIDACKELFTFLLRVLLYVLLHVEAILCCIVCTWWSMLTIRDMFRHFTRWFIIPLPLTYVFFISCEMNLFLIIGGAVVTPLSLWSLLAPIFDFWSDHDFYRALRTLPEKQPFLVVPVAFLCFFCTDPSFSTITRELGFFVLELLAMIELEHG